MREYVLYKFKTINKYLFESLVNSELYFAEPEKLNDPFDCQVDMQKALKVAAAQASDALKPLLESFWNKKRFFGWVENRLRTVGICSFSQSRNNTLMWSHYAQSHEGVCLKYVFPVDFFYENKRNILGIGPVTYGSRPLVDWLLGNASKYNDTKEFIDELTMVYWTIKDKPWRYEREWRIIRDPIGPHPIAKEFLKQICFGLKATDPDIRLVRTLALDCGYKVGFRRMVRHEKSDFALAAVPL